MAYKIGDKAEGGIVFYVNESGEHGLVTAETDQSTNANWEDAIKTCSELALNGYRDWFLPSRNLLNLMYTNLQKKGLGGFAADWYWSSTVVDNLGAWDQDFNFGDQSNHYKVIDLNVRAARAF